MDTGRFTDFRKKIIENCSEIIVGKEEIIEKLMISFLCGGHVLLEDVPGTENHAAARLCQNGGRRV